MVNEGNHKKHDEGWAVNAARVKYKAACPSGRLRYFGLAAAFLALAAMVGDGQAWGAVRWSVGQRAVVAAALKSTVPAELALAVAHVGREERLRGEGVPGAVGVMQVRPSLAREELGVRVYGLEDMRANAGVGVTLLERLNRRYDGRWDLTLSHYQRGPLLKCKEGPVMHDDTLQYVAAVMDWWVRYQKDEAAAALIDETRRVGFRANGALSRADGNEQTRERDGRARRWRPFAERRHSPADHGCDEAARGRSQFRSDDRPVCGGVRSRRFF